MKLFISLFKFVLIIRFLGCVMISVEDSVKCIIFDLKGVSVL